MHVRRDQLLNTWEPDAKNSAVNEICTTQEANGNHRLDEIVSTKSSLGFLPQANSDKIQNGKAPSLNLQLIVAIQKLRQPESFHTNRRQRKNIKARRCFII
jgi:hypothetical protein